jgi:hypothetical protein
MSELVHCWECAHHISSAARQCPACQTTFPFGRVCAICMTARKASTGTVTYSGEYVFCWIDAICHEELVREYHPLYYSCSVCGNTETAKTEFRAGVPFPVFMDACARCGHPLDSEYRAVECRRCRTLLFPRSDAAAWKYMHARCAAYAYKELQDKQQEQQHQRSVEGQSGCLAIMVLFASIVVFCVVSAT